MKSTIIHDTLLIAAGIIACLLPCILLYFMEVDAQCSQHVFDNHALRMHLEYQHYLDAVKWMSELPK